MPFNRVTETKNVGSFFILILYLKKTNHDKNQTRFIKTHLKNSHSYRSSGRQCDLPFPSLSIQCPDKANLLLLFRSVCPAVQVPLQWLTRQEPGELLSGLSRSVYPGAPGVLTWFRRFFTWLGIKLNPSWARFRSLSAVNIKRWNCRLF